MREYRRAVRLRESRSLAERAKVMRRLVQEGYMDGPLALSWVIDPPENFRKKMAA